MIVLNFNPIALKSVAACNKLLLIGYPLFIHSPHFFVHKMKTVPEVLNGLSLIFAALFSNRFLCNLLFTVTLLSS